MFPARLAAVFLLSLAQMQTAIAAIVNDATASATYNGNPVASPVSSASVGVAPFAPVLLVTKSAVLNDDDGNPGITAGDTISYLMTVRNSGNVNIVNYAFSDVQTQGGVVQPLTSGPTLTGGDTVNPGVLDVGEAWTYQASYTLTQANLDDGRDIINVAVASGTGQGIGVNGSSTVTVDLNQVRQLTVTKTPATANYSAAGQTVSWNVTVQNSGTVTLNALTVSDPVADTVACTISGNATIATLAAGASESCVATRMVTAADMAAPSIDNIVTASGATPGGVLVSGTDSASIPRIGADLVTVKTLASGTANPLVGDTVTFAIAVTNNGPANATNVSLTDLIPTGLTPTTNNGTVSAGVYNAGTGVWTLPALANGASATLTIEGTVDAGITGAITNTTTAAVGDQLDPNRAGDDLTETVNATSNALVAVDNILTTPFDTANPVTGAVNVLGNDTLNGLTIAAGIVSVNAVGTLPAGFTLNPDGTVDIAQFTPPGTYTFDYQICEVLNPTNCDTATVTIPVIRSLPRLSGTVYTDFNGNALYDGTDTPLPGYTVQLVLNGAIIATQLTDANGDYSFESFTPGTYDVVFIDTATGMGVGLIQDVVVADRDVIVDQDMPVDPSGVIYNSVTGAPIAGATVTLTDRNGTPLPAACLLPNQQGQVTGASGAYRFDVVVAAAPQCPAGETEYRLMVVPPAGYLALPSTNIPPQPGSLDATTCPPDTIPGGACQMSSSGTPSVSSPTPYFLVFLIASGDPDIVNNHIPLDPVPVIPPTELTLTKTASTSIARRGDPVVYTLTAANASNTAAGPVTLTDRLPDGFTYVPGSAILDGTTVLQPTPSGRSLTFTNLTVPANGTAIIRITVRIAASVEPGDHVNEALLTDPTTGDPLAPLARATVRIEPEHVFDCGEIIGKVFDDRNRNGIQDAETSPYAPEPGIPGVRVATVNGVLITTDEHGRFSIPCADIPDADIGSNFILKLDERTLPTGFRVTTENPRTVRLTRGKVTKLNFGAAIQKVITINLNQNAFVDSTAEPVPDLGNNLDELVQVLAKEPSLLRLNYYAGPEGKALANRRLKAIRAIIRGKWEKAGNGYELPVEIQVVVP